MCASEWHAFCVCVLCPRMWLCSGRLLMVTSSARANCTRAHTHREATHAANDHVHRHVAQHLGAMLLPDGLELGLEGCRVSQV